MQEDIFRQQNEKKNCDPDPQTSHKSKRKGCFYHRRKRILEGKFKRWKRTEIIRCSVSQSCLTLCNPMNFSTPGFPVHHQLLELAQTHLLSRWCHPTIYSPVIPFSSCLQSLSIRVFSKESAPHIRWPKYWSFSITPSNEYSELVSFRNDWFTLFVSKGFSSLLQHHSSKAPTLQSSAFFMVQFSHPNMITGKTIALTLQTFLGKVMSLVFNICLFLSLLSFQAAIDLISWLQSLSTVILEPKKIKLVTVSTVSPFICHEVMEPDALLF